VGLFDKIKGEFIDIVEWTDETRDTIVYRFERYENEIKMGAKLVVREGQTALFVNEGTLADVFVPGTYTLETQNLPILSTLKGWKHGFHSPFKAEVYFVSTRSFTDFKWGTQNPAMMRDPEFGMVRVRAFGTYAMKVADPTKLLRELVGTDPTFSTDEIGEFLRQSVVTRAVTALASSGVSVIDLAAHQNDIADKLAPVISADLAPLGLTLPRFVIENVSLPVEVEEAIDQRAKLQAAEAITIAAENPGGLAGAGAGLGAGAAIGAAMAGGLQPAPAAHAQAAAPPPLPATTVWFLGIDGQQVGPLSVEQVRARLADGSANGETLAWRDGMAGWTAVAQVPDLAPTTPPPLPGS
jgi:membrane protease subunit (stomatin/prohibitin family)